MGKILKRLRREMYTDTFGLPRSFKSLSTGWPDKSWPGIRHPAKRTRSGIRKGAFHLLLFCPLSTEPIKTVESTPSLGHGPLTAQAGCNPATSPGFDQPCPGPKPSRASAPVSRQLDPGGRAPAACLSALLLALEDSCCFFSVSPSHLPKGKLPRTQRSNSWPGLNIFGYGWRVLFLP